MEVLSLALIADCSDRSGRQFLTMLRGCWCAVRQATAAVTEPKRLGREIREEHQRILSGADDPVRRGIVTGRHSFVAHYHSERNHQGLANRLILPEAGHLGNAGTNTEAPAAWGAY